jgi:hypothetical protein
VLGVDVGVGVGIGVGVRCWHWRLALVLSSGVGVRCWCWCWCWCHLALALVSIHGGVGVGIHCGPFVGRLSPPPSTPQAVARSRGVGGVLVLWWCHPGRDPLSPSEQGLTAVVGGCKADGHGCRFVVKT